MKVRYAALAAVIVALASGTALARDHGGGGHAGGFAGSAASAPTTGGHSGGRGPGFSGGQFARGNSGSPGSGFSGRQFARGSAGSPGAGFSGRQFDRANGGGHVAARGFHHGFHGGPRFGVTFGSPFFVDSYYYDYAPLYTTPAPAYYCASAGAYYPDVPYCPEGWQQVAPWAPRY